MLITGLAHNNFLVNGKFQLTSGKDKVADDVLLFFSFFNNRIYMPDYGVSFLFLVQKTSSFFFQFRPLLLGQIRQRVQKQLPKAVNFESISADYYRESKDINVSLSYYVVEDPLEINTISVFI